MTRRQWSRVRDPGYELRDWYTEQINQHSILTSNGKYDVSRLIENVVVPVGRLTGGTPVPPTPVPPDMPPDQKLLAV